LSKAGIHNHLVQLKFKAKLYIVQPSLSGMLKLEYIVYL